MDSTYDKSYSKDFINFFMKNLFCVYYHMLKVLGSASVSISEFYVFSIPEDEKI